MFDLYGAVMNQRRQFVVNSIPFRRDDRIILTPLALSLARTVPYNVRH